MIQNKIMCVCVFVCVQFVCQERENGKAYMVKKKKKKKKNHVWRIVNITMCYFCNFFNKSKIILKLK